MQDAKLLSTKDVREIIAKHFDVPLENVVKSQYSYTVILGKRAEEEEAE